MHTAAALAWLGLAWLGLAYGLLFATYAAASVRASLTCATVRQTPSLVPAQVHSQQSAADARAEPSAACGRSFLCAADGCAASFASSLLLQEHITQQHPPACATCNRRFRSAKQLRVHQRTVHVSLVDVSTHWQCIQPGCLRTFTMKRNLVAHLRTSHGENAAAQFGCTECSRKFRHKQTLTAHMRSVHAADGLPVRSASVDSLKRSASALEQIAGGVDLRSSSAELELSVSSQTQSPCPAKPSGGHWQPELTARLSRCESASES